MFPLPSLKAVFVTRDASDKNSLELRSNERKYVIIFKLFGHGCDLGQVGRICNHQPK